MKKAESNRKSKNLIVAVVLPCKDQGTTKRKEERSGRSKNRSKRKVNNQTRTKQNKKSKTVETGWWKNQKNFASAVVGPLSYRAVLFTAVPVEACYEGVRNPESLFLLVQSRNK